MMKRNKRRALIGGSIAATLLSKSQASADLFGGDISDWYWADSTTHTFCQGSGLSNAEFDQIEARMAHLDAFTDMQDTVTGCTPGVDILAEDVNIPWLGVAWCNFALPESPKVCQEWILQVDFAAHGGDQEDLEQTLCHEIGHTTGLEHDTADGAHSCMMTPQQIDGEHLVYTQHHKDHINARY